MKSDFLIALTQVAAEHHLPKEVVLQAIEAALASAFKKDNLVAGQNISVKLNPNTGEIKVYALRTVVEKVGDPRKEITLEEARKIKRDAALGDTVAIETTSHQASRIAAQTAKQVVLQRLREAERERIYNEFSSRVNDILSGTVEQIEAGRVILDLGRVQAILPQEEQVPTERYRRGQRLKVYVVKVERTPRGPEIIVSRSHRNLLKRLFELEVPEVSNGIVEIKAIAREPGSRSKVAVAARQEGVDPVGSCIGMRGNRIQNIVNELQGEKIDVVRWHKDVTTFIAQSLSPSEVILVELNDEEKTATVVVPDKQLSLAIGKEGQNARLAAKLMGWRLDIKGLSEWEAIRAKQQAREAEERRAAERAEAAVAVEEAPPEPLPEEAVAAAIAPEEELAALATGTGVQEVVEEETPSEVGEEVWKLPAITLETGKLRFAEDILGERKGKEKKAKRPAREEKARKAPRKVRFEEEELEDL
jgi:N utilization substance protein A